MICAWLLQYMKVVRIHEVFIRYQADLAPHSQTMRSGTIHASWMRSDPPFPADVSPINLLTASFPPTFVIVATADWLIPPSESYSVVEKLKELGVEATYADAVGMGHGVCEDPRSSWPEGQRWWEEAVEPSLEWAEKKLRA
jgi:acetyl esterase/lipase